MITHISFMYIDVFTHIHAHGDKAMPEMLHTEHLQQVHKCIDVQAISRYALFHTSTDIHMYMLHHVTI